MRAALARPLGQARTFGAGAAPLPICTSESLTLVPHRAEAGSSPAPSWPCPKRRESRYGPTSTRVRLFGPGLERSPGSPCPSESMRITSADVRLSRPSPARTIPAAIRPKPRCRVGCRRGGRARAAASAAAGWRRLGAGCVVGCGAAVCRRRPPRRPAPAGVDDAGTGAGDAGCGRESAAALVAALAGRSSPPPAWLDAGSSAPRRTPSRRPPRTAAPQ